MMLRNSSGVVVQQSRSEGECVRGGCIRLETPDQNKRKPVEISRITLSGGLHIILGEINRPMVGELEMHIYPLRLDWPIKAAGVLISFVAMTCFIVTAFSDLGRHSQRETTASSLDSIYIHHSSLDCNQ